MSDTATEVQPDLQALAAATTPPAETTPAPESGQGNEGTSGLYSLDTVPENLREQVAPIFKEWDANVTREFQKRAEELNAWKPYDELGLRDVPVEDMQSLMSFYEVASDEDSLKAWVQAAAEQFGLLGGAPAPAPEGDPAATAPEGAADTATPGENLSPEKVQEMVQQAIEQDRAQREQQEQQQEIHDTVARTVRETLDGFSLPGDTPEAKSEAEELVCFFAGKHQGEGVSVQDALKAGFADYQRMLNAAGSDALDEKVKQPAATAVTEGQPNSAPSPAQTFADARERTLERLRAANAQ